MAGEADIDTSLRGRRNQCRLVPKDEDNLHATGGDHSGNIYGVFSNFSAQFPNLGRGCGIFSDKTSDTLSVVWYDFVKHRGDLGCYPR